MPPLQAAPRTSALVMAVAFPHHAAQENPHPKPGEIAALIVQAETVNALAEVENIVVETAEKIFADLADAQTINSDKNGGWKAPLWQALTEAGLPLSWVPEACGGSGASLAEGFSVLGAAGRFALAVPLAETMLAGWLLAQANISSPEGTMTVAPAGPKDRLMLGADGTLSGRAAFPSPGMPNILRCRRTAPAVFRSRWSKPAPAGSKPASISAATATIP